MVSRCLAGLGLLLVFTLVPSRASVEAISTQLACPPDYTLQTTGRVSLEEHGLDVTERPGAGRQRFTLRCHKEGTTYMAAEVRLTDKPRGLVIFLKDGIGRGGGMDIEFAALRIEFHRE